MTFIKEGITSVQRHFANNYSDPHRQNSINLFLGLFQPKINERTTIWDFDEKDLHNKDSMPEMTACWWEPHLRGYES
jgi:hypothetical protein